MSVQWQDQQTAEQLAELGINHTWQNTNQRWDEDYHKDPLAPAHGVLNGLTVAAIFWVPVLCYLWVTR